MKLWQYIKWKYPCNVCITSWFQTFVVFWMFYAFYWVILRRLSFIYRRFGTLCLFHLHRRVGMKNEDGTERVFRNVGIKIQTPENYPEGSIQHTYNLTLRRVLATIVAVEKQYVLYILIVCVCVCVCVCVLYPFVSSMQCACVIFICGLSDSTVFFHIIIKRHDFRKRKVIEYKMGVLIFSTTFIWKKLSF